MSEPIQSPQSSEDMINQLEVMLDQLESHIAELCEENRHLTEQNVVLVKQLQQKQKNQSLANKRLDESIGQLKLVLEG